MWALFLCFTSARSPVLERGREMWIVTEWDEPALLSSRLYAWWWSPPPPPHTMRKHANEIGKGFWQQPPFAIRTMNKRRSMKEYDCATIVLPYAAADHLQTNAKQNQNPLPCSHTVRTLRTCCVSGARSSFYSVIKLRWCCYCQSSLVSEERALWVHCSGIARTSSGLCVCVCVWFRLQHVIVLCRFFVFPWSTRFTPKHHKQPHTNTHTARHTHHACKLLVYQRQARRKE